ncbi:MerR family transcriptional regulator [Caloramator sp. E03]|uniref:MerR family transcriptional regulator n=1 Tax=Caloramator sp. E03 TaxID=2576307 RepID=UPI00143CD586|nr:MerR family transcriptional regulator [Caloramator sp. E03]
MGGITYTFKDVCEKTGYKASVIRYYEKEFNLNIPRDVNGRRFFTQKEFDKLIFIRQLQQQGYTNGQIKKILEDNRFEGLQEIAIAKDLTFDGNDASLLPLSQNIIKIINEKLQEINCNINELNKNISSKERDVLISENMKLKMELKQKSYEIIELKEKLKYEKERKKGFLSKIFKKDK